MMDTLISIIINNYNYARFLRRSIDSALAQTHPNTEVIVVDDASTDGSAAVIHSYGDAVVPVFKSDNAGHGAAFNTGFRASRGDLVIFLDADDYLYPSTAARVLAVWKPDVAQIQYRLDLVDGIGRRLDLYPAPEVAFDDGNVVPLLLANGRYQTTVTSGAAFPRTVLDAILPMPEPEFRQGADGYVVTLAPLFGRVVSIEDALGAYCQHGDNHSGFAKELAERARWRLLHDGYRYQALARNAGEHGLTLAAEPGLRDPLHVEERLASLCMDPANHPVPGDRRLLLACHGLRASRNARLPAKRQAILRAWFLAVGLLPRPLARAAVSWKLQAVSRPWAFKWLAKAVRAAAK